MNIQENHKYSLNLNPPREHAHMQLKCGRGPFVNWHTEHFPYGMYANVLPLTR